MMNKIGLTGGIRQLGFIVFWGIWFWLLYTGVTLAQTGSELNDTQLDLLTKLDYQLSTLDDLSNRGFISRLSVETQQQDYLAEVVAELNEAQIRTLLQFKYKLDTIDDLRRQNLMADHLVQVEKQHHLSDAQAIIGNTLTIPHLWLLLNYLDQRRLAQASSANSSANFSLVWLLVGLTAAGGISWLGWRYVRPTSRRAVVTSLAAPTLPSGEHQNGMRHEQLTQARLVMAEYQAHQYTTREARPGQLTANLPVVNVVEALTPREQEVLQLAAIGLSNEEIAGRFVISAGTVKVHLSNIYGKLGVTKRIQAIAKAKSLGLLPPI
jgi:DNA-binding CsgD family transcriptional regulator